MKCKRNIAILMATYNGAKYLNEQIDSILQQSYNDWELFIHDDGSTDSTLSIANRYQDQYPERIHILDYAVQGSAARNFMSLLEHVEADYFMFCDQDDVWNPDKIETEIDEMMRWEDSGKPVLIATDLFVVDKELRPLHPSLWSIAGIYPQHICSFDDMAANTIVTGCTMLLNAKAKECIKPYTTKMTMHDAWIACCVMKAGGILRCLNIQTVKYRQHDNNSLGARNVANEGITDKIKHIGRSWAINKAHYLMLRELNYGSIFKYINHKWKYHKSIKKHLKQ